jgi:histidinol dehydrogenase
MTPLNLRFRGAIDSLGREDRAALLDRAGAGDPDVRASVSAAIARIEREGDAAVRAMMREFHGVDLEALEVPRARRSEALARLAPDLRAAMERAAANVEKAHRAWLPKSIEVETEPGVRIVRRPDPLERVGVYAPGGRAAYPSTVLMCAIPARVAEVREIMLCSPPGANGAPSDLVLAAAEMAGVTRVFAIGGAAAIAAMALGTASVPRVDRIVGPGNAWVAEAKLMLTHRVSIDSPAGPSEALVIADDGADPDLVAREMIAQAEHDPLACSLAILIGERGRDALERALERRVRDAARGEIIALALAARGGVLTAASVERAIDFANAYAPEHLLLVIADAKSVIDRVRNAGTVFVGGSSSVAFGDYMTGANHTLPTGGLARSYSGLSTLDFVRWTTIQSIEPAAAKRLAQDVARLARAEGLPAHADAALAWEASS